MKRLSLVILIAAALFAAFILSPVQAQGFDTDAKIVEGDQDNGVVIQFVATVDSLNSYTSKAFYLSEYDGESFYSYPIAYGKIASSAADTPQVKAIIQGTYGDGTWFNVDTVSTSDSIETYNSGTLDLNNKKCLAYRLSVAGVTTNAGDTIYTLSLYAYRREDKAR